MTATIQILPRLGFDLGSDVTREMGLLSYTGLNIGTWDGIVMNNPTISDKSTCSFKKQLFKTRTNFNFPIILLQI